MVSDILCTEPPVVTTIFTHFKWGFNIVNLFLFHMIMMYVIVVNIKFL